MSIFMFAEVRGESPTHVVLDVSNVAPRLRPADSAPTARPGAAAKPGTKTAAKPLAVASIMAASASEAAPESPPLSASSRRYRRPWTDAEDSLLTAAVSELGAAQWSKVAHCVPNRDGKQCRERWLGHLCPDIKHGAWSEEEDRLIAEGVKEFGTCWSEIVKRLPGRSDNAIKNRFNVNLRHAHRQQREDTRRVIAAQPPKAKRAKPPVAGGASVAGSALGSTHWSNTLGVAKEEAAAMLARLPSAATPAVDTPTDVSLGSPASSGRGTPVDPNLFRDDTPVDPDLFGYETVDDRCESEAASECEAAQGKESGESGLLHHLALACQHASIIGGGIERGEEARSAEPRAPSRERRRVKFWTAEEDEQLTRAIAAAGPLCTWRSIATMMQTGREGKQCRERWVQHLCPQVKHGDFSEEEDNILIAAVMESGSRWSEIAKRLPGRSDNAIKNRYHCLQRQGARSAAEVDAPQPSRKRSRSPDENQSCFLSEELLAAARAAEAAER